MAQAVFFDLDGTLVDTAPDFHVVLNQVLAEAGRPAQSLAAVRTQVSNGARALVTLGFGLVPEDAAFPDTLDTLLNAYAARLDVDTCLFPGMAEVLARLDADGTPWGVVTNKPARFTAPVLRGLGLSERVGPVICPDDVVLRKPDPEGLLKAAAMVGVDPARCLYVGDHLRDIEAGRNAGMTTVAALFGYLDPNEDPRAWHADYYIDAADALLPLLDQDMHS
ncbi:HAD-IA family hydrolase [Alcanivorax sp. JB21]|uniref:HAD-IA family hydrolase n=1 Tax=Alcanivorax limicola TaxID=2874102 RepID=UPI001CBD99C8|nr:HAD-IA family hydrolase [Alcanivorax limicola]MBZ2188168.1 HAD-IA family hydrolase [Alcanivorax limicola]